MEKVVTATCALNTQTPLSSLFPTPFLPLRIQNRKFLSPSAQIHALLHKPQYYLTLGSQRLKFYSNELTKKSPNSVHCRGNLYENVHTYRCKLYILITSLKIYT